MSETVEQVDEIEKEGAVKEYDPVYIKELLSAVKPHFAQGVWDEMHRKARAKAGGKAAGRNRAAADSQSATAVLSEPESAAVDMQPPVAKASKRYVIKDQTEDK